MQNLLNAAGIYDYSSPLFMYCWEYEYEEVNPCKKVLFIGQKTNSWFDCGSSLNADSLNQVLSNYEDFDLGNGYNSPFWRFIKELNSKLNNPEHGSLWTNVNKFGNHGAAGRPDQKVLDLENSYFNILKDELKILNPEAVIFLTGPNYDNDIKNKLGSTRFIKCTEYEPNEFAQVKNRYLPEKSFRNYHPNYLNYNGLFNDYLNKLVNLI